MPTFIPPDWERWLREIEAGVYPAPPSPPEVAMPNGSVLTFTDFNNALFSIRNRIPLTMEQVQKLDDVAVTGPGNKTVGDIVRGSRDPDEGMETLASEAFLTESIVNGEEELPVYLDGDMIGTGKILSISTPLGGGGDWVNKYIQKPFPDDEPDKLQASSKVDVGGQLHNFSFTFNPDEIPPDVKDELLNRVGFGVDPAKGPDISIGYSVDAEGRITPFEASIMSPVASSGEEEDNQNMEPQDGQEPELEPLVASIEVKGLDDFRKRMKAISDQLGKGISAALSSLGQEAVKAALASEEVSLALKKIKEDAEAAERLAEVEEEAKDNPEVWEERYREVRHEFTAFRLETEAKMKKELGIIKQMREQMDAHTAEVKERLKQYQGTCESCQFFCPLKEAGERIGVCEGLSSATLKEHLEEELFASFFLPLLTQDSAYLRVSADFRCNQYRRDPDWIESEPKPEPKVEEEQEVSDYWTCSNCGENRNPYNVLKCISCSVRLNFWKCPDCHNHCDENDEYCHVCGRNFVGNSWRCLSCLNSNALKYAGCHTCGQQRNAVKLNYTGEWSCPCGHRIPSGYDQCGVCETIRCPSCGAMFDADQGDCHVCHYEPPDPKVYTRATRTATGRMSSSSPNLQTPGPEGWRNINNVADINGPDADYDLVDVTSISDQFQRFMRVPRMSHPGGDYVCSQCLDTVSGGTTICPNCKAEHWRCNCGSWNYAKTKTVCGGCGCPRP